MGGLIPGRLKNDSHPGPEPPSWLRQGLPDAGPLLSQQQKLNLDLFVKTPRQPGARWG